MVCDGVATGVPFLAKHKLAGSTSGDVDASARRLRDQRPAFSALVCDW
jgi:hypothetical protein